MGLKPEASLSQPPAGAVQKQEAQAMTPEEKHEHVCPTCALNAYKAEQEAAARQKAADRVTALETELATAKTNQPQPQVPSLMDLVAHCESGSCSHHAEEWNTVKAQIIERIPADYIKSKASELGMIEKPAAQAEAPHTDLPLRIVVGE
jgi:hypothetical protein